VTAAWRASRQATRASQVGSCEHRLSVERSRLTGRTGVAPVSFVPGHRLCLSAVDRRLLRLPRGGPAAVCEQEAMGAAAPWTAENDQLQAVPSKRIVVDLKTGVEVPLMQMTEKTQRAHLLSQVIQQIRHAAQSAQRILGGRARSVGTLADTPAAIFRSRAGRCRSGNGHPGSVRRYEDLLES
jgi:hypothetical protein